MQLRPSSPSSLPAIDTASRDHSRRVADSLRQAISAAGGSLGFGAFMQQALYAPGLGYYSAGARKFGAAGDFVTAPEVSPLFGQVVARQLAGTLRALGGGDILEIGAGSGVLAVQVLKKLAELDCLPRRYLVLDVSPDLVERQQQRIASEVPELAARVRWLDSPPADFTGVMLANEVLDALPVERFRRSGERIEQMQVAFADDGFAFTSADAPGWLDAKVRAIEASLGGPLPDGYVSELSPGLHAWIGDFASALTRGVFLLFDYGVSRREYYAPDRSGGFLRCHYRHHAHNDPLLWPGIQDITAWVDFTAVAEAAVAAGLDVTGYVTQSRFLLDGGLLEEVAAVPEAGEIEQLELSRQVKLLTLPGEMGEHFKCIGLARGISDQPQAVVAGDSSHRL